MQSFKLANVLLESNDRANDYPELYCVCSKTIPYNAEDGSFSLFPYEKFDFATFFNALPYKKWRRYTVVEEAKIHLEIEGPFEVVFTRHDATLARPKRTVLQRQLHQDDGVKVIDYTYREAENADFLSFEIITYGMCKIRNSYYYADVDESLIREVFLSVATTTFKQEKFIIPNIELFKDEVIGGTEAVSSCFHMHVIDNGRTLDAEALSCKGVTVHPNKNVGGAGGFTRGMIEAMRQDPPATHVLLMDDDVQISTESIKRTFNVLSLVNDTYVEAFISGAMISYERQDEFYEDVGCVRSDGLYGPIKAKLDLSDFEDVVANDTLEVRKPNRYAGWWYCCIPVSSIKEHGLPLPLFIRGDDAEYGNRAAKRFITMNGICVWHLTLALKFRAAFERYQVHRNSLIAQASTGVYKSVDFMEQFKHNIQLDFKTFNYDGVELSLDALEDYLAGPEFIMKDQGERLIQEHSKKNETLTDLDEIQDPRIPRTVVDPTEFFEKSERTSFQKLVDYLSYNGHRLPSFMLRKDLAVIPWDGWFYPAKKIRMHRDILAVSIDGKQGIIRTMDKKRFRELMKRYKALMKRYNSTYDSVRQQYSDAREYITSIEFWKKYLEID